MIHKKLLSLLVLLMTAASGAWADELTVYDGTGTNAYVPVYGFYADAYLKCQTVYPATELAAMAGSSINSITYYATSPASGAWAATFQVHVIEVADATISSFNDLSTATLVYEGTLDGTQSTMAIPFTTPYNYQGGNLLVSVSLTTKGAYNSITWGGETVEGASVQGYNYSDFNAISATQRNFLPKTTFTYGPSNVDVTTDAAEAGAAFTEATFTMPAYNATVNYDIVRDMEDADNPVEFSGIDERIIVKMKTGTGTYEPLTPLTIQLLDQLAATDAQNIIADAGIKVKVLKGTDNNGTITYDETNPLTLEAFTADMQPGLYKMVAEPADATTSPYTGTASLAFEAIAGFPVEIAAQEYVTYYSANDNLTLEENSGAKLYTITGIGETKATATEIPSANKEMPFLVYNPTEETKTFLLIPTDTEINQTYADEFKGTAVATTIAASTDAQTNYAFNGKQFVWVRTALPVAANKAWLEVLTSTARSIALVFADDDATAISAVSGSPADNGDIYDLNGRKLDKKPTRKGVYIQNGRKVVVK